MGWSNLAIVRASWTKRLWLAVAGIAVFIATAWSARFVVPPSEPHSSGFGLDFIAFYTAGSFVKQGRLGELYDLEAVHYFQRNLATLNHFDLGRAFGPWWNPPFYALAFEPFARMPYPIATVVWVALNLACFAAACVLLCKLLPKGTKWRVWGLIPALTILSAPFILAVSHAQNTCTSLLLLAATVMLWRGGRPLLAGLIGGLMFYKPQLAAVLALVLAIDLGWRGLAGYAITGSCLLLTNFLLLPGTIADYLHRLPQNIHALQDRTAYPWEQHVTLKAFWRLLLQGHALGTTSAMVMILTTLLAGALAVLLIRSAVRVRGIQSPTPRSLARDRLIAATIVATPLLMPFYFDYDLLLLAVPAVLFATERIASKDRAPAHIERTTILFWAALYAWQMVNAEFGGRFHVNGSVILLAILAWNLIDRVKWTESAEIAHQGHPFRLARAA